MQTYRDYWNQHARSVGAVGAVTGWSMDQYNDFYRDILTPVFARKIRKVADVGCGPALLIPLIQEFENWASFDYYGYDISEEMIKYAGKQNPNRRFTLVDGPLVIKPKVDLIICHSVFTHITPDDTIIYLRAFKLGLKKNGVISASIHTDCKRGYTGSIARFDYAPAFFEALVEESGLKVEGFIDTQVPAGPVRYYRLVA